MSIRDELLSLKNDDGLIIAEDAVDWAKSNPSSALYGALEWDDRAAGREYRIWQVRRLIAVSVTYADGQRQVVSLSIDRGRTGGGYRQLEDVLPDKGLREQLLD